MQSPRNSQRGCKPCFLGSHANSPCIINPPIGTIRIQLPYFSIGDFMLQLVPSVNPAPLDSPHPSPANKIHTCARKNVIVRKIYENVGGCRITFGMKLRNLTFGGNSRPHRHLTLYPRPVHGYSDSIICRPRKKKTTNGVCLSTAPTVGARPLGCTKPTTLNNKPDTATIPP